MKTSTGFEEILISDPQQNLQFPMLVMYPTTTPPASTMFGPYDMNVAVKAPIIEGVFPLVVISHGSGGSPLVYRDLASRLAEVGFIVCAPEHPFNNRNNNDHQDTIENMIDRPRHIRLCIDFLFANQKWNSHLQKSNLMMIGHSMGAYTALVLAGGVAHTKHQIEHDPETKIKISQEIAVEPEQRIKALVLFAPAAGWFYSEGSLAKVKTPMLIYTAEKDTITPEFHADIIKMRISDPDLITHKKVANAGHFSFLAPFPESLKRPNFLPAQDPPGFDRVAFHEVMIKEVLQFLRDKNHDTL